MDKKVYVDGVVLVARRHGTGADLDRLDLPHGERFHRETNVGMREFWLADPGEAAAPQLWARLVREFQYSGYWPLLVPDLVTPAHVGGQGGWGVDREWGPGETDVFGEFGATGAYSVIDEPFAAIWADALAFTRHSEQYAVPPRAPLDPGHYLSKRFGELGGTVPDSFPSAARAPLRPARAPVSLLVSIPQPRILLVPVEDPSDVPLVVDWGIANEDLTPGRFTSSLRQWHRRYGVVLTSFAWTYTYLQCPEPPTSDAAVMDLAMELQMFADDSWSQGGVSGGGYTGLRLVDVVRERQWGIWWD